MSGLEGLLFILLLMAMSPPGKTDLSENRQSSKYKEYFYRLDSEHRYGDPACLAKSEYLTQRELDYQRDSIRRFGDGQQLKYLDPNTGICK